MPCDTDLARRTLDIGARIGLTATIDTTLSCRALDGGARFCALSIDGTTVFVVGTRACSARSDASVVLASAIETELVGLRTDRGLGVASRRHTTARDADLGRRAIEIDLTGLAVDALSRDAALS